MPDDKPEDINIVKTKFNEASRFYDNAELTLENKLYHELEWEILIKDKLPENRQAKILDAGGGTGRITLPLAKMGYRVTLCDLSPGMLSVAEEKLMKEGLRDRIEIKEADITSLPFDDETFDLVICLHGSLSDADSFRAAGELSRVLKKGGTIIADVLSRYWAVAHEINRNPELALGLVSSGKNHTYDVHNNWQRVFTPDEFKELFIRNNIRVIDIFGSFYQLPGDEVWKKRDRDDTLLSQIATIMKHLRSVPSAIGMARELIIVGEKQ